MKNENKIKFDKRKIPQFFRAVEKDTRPRTYFGFLVDDTGFVFTSYSCHDGDESVFKERSLEKHDFTFSKIDKEEFRVKAGIALSRMAEELTDAKFEFEKKEHLYNFSKEKITEILKM